MAFPTSEFVDCTFTLVEAVSLARTASGKAVARVEYGDPYFTARIETAPLYRDRRAAWEAWKATLRGGMVSFTTWDRSKPELLAYPAGVPEIVAETWNGEGTVATLAARLITAAGSPSGFQMKAGDHIGLVEGGRRYLGIVTADCARGASNIAVPVEPAVPPGIFTTAATVVFYRPEAEFILLADTFQCPRGPFLAPVSFEGVQKV